MRHEDHCSRLDGWGTCDCDAEQEPKPEPHDCRENEVEHQSHLTRSGRFTAWGECALCGRETTPPYVDSVL